MSSDQRTASIGGEVTKAPHGWTDEEIHDLISDAIGDSMEMDWTYSDGAKSVFAALQKEGLIRSEPMSSGARAWPDGSFSVHDPDPKDDHGPIYLVCPTGLMVNFSADPTPGLDASRVQWIADTLNSAHSTNKQVDPQSGGGGR